MCNLYLRGIKHDLSKFSRIEFSEAKEYYNGKESPINICKKKKGYSPAWLHHKGKNDHHYQYWVDDFDHGGKALRMPYEPAVEMVCDYLGAGRTYMGKDFTYRKELQWWENKSHPDNHMLMHEDTVLFVTIIMNALANLEEKYQLYAGGNENTRLSDSWVEKKILNDNILTELYNVILSHNDKKLQVIANKMTTVHSKKQ